MFSNSFCLFFLKTYIHTSIVYIFHLYTCMTALNNNRLAPHTQEKKKKEEEEAKKIP